MNIARTLKAFSLVAILGLFSAASAFGQAVIVKQMDFDLVDSGVKKDKHLAISIELEGGTNTNPDAKNSRYVDDISVTLMIGFKLRGSSSEYSFYQAKAELVTLEQGEDVTVRFYISPEVLDRDNLDREPFAYLADVAVGGEAIPLTNKARSSSLSSPNVVESFKGRINSEAGVNSGNLVPIYDTIFWTGVDRRQLADLPAYKRKAD